MRDNNRFNVQASVLRDGDFVASMRDTCIKHIF